jgi:leucyl/phenylalanyl-tRNA---protein transferase
MPVEPPPTPWAFPGPADYPPGEDLVGVGANLEPGTLLAAYRLGLFPMPSPGRGPVQWFHPVRRGILPLDAMVVSRSLRRSCRRYDVRVNTAFEAVMVGCADPSRRGSWIDREIVEAYVRLHDLGWAHSVETWLSDGQDDQLVGGVYGVAIGGLFAGESMFHRERDAAKVALAGLVDLLRAEDADRRLLDVQWRTPFLGTLGVVEIDRSAYLDRLADALPLPVPAAFSG